MSEVSTYTFEDKVIEAFNGYDKYVVTKEGGTNYFEKNGVKLPFYHKAIGWNGIFQLTLVKPRHGYNSEGIVRVTEKTNIDQHRFRVRFGEQANYAVKEVLEKQITEPSLAKNQADTEKAFKKWQRDNAKYLGHKIIREVVLEQNYSGTKTTSVGLDRLITSISTGDHGIPSLTQIFGIIVQSGIKVYNVGNDIKVIGNGEETTAFIELIDHFLEWKY